MIDGVDNEQTFTVTDIHIGNLKQGLVCSLRRGLDDARDQDRRGAGQISFSQFVRPADSAQGVGVISGDLKAALVAETVETIDGVDVQSRFGNNLVLGSYVSFDFRFSMEYVEDDNIIPPDTFPGWDVDADFVERIDPDCD